MSTVIVDSPLGDAVRVDSINGRTIGNYNTVPVAGGDLASIFHTERLAQQLVCSIVGVGGFVAVRIVAFNQATCFVVDPPVGILSFGKRSIGFKQVAFVIVFVGRAVLIRIGDFECLSEGIDLLCDDRAVRTGDRCLAQIRAVGITGSLPVCICLAEYPVKCIVTCTSTCAAPKVGNGDLASQTVVAGFGLESLRIRRTDDATKCIILDVYPLIDAVFVGNGICRLSFFIVDVQGFCALSVVDGGADAFFITKDVISHPGDGALCISDCFELSQTGVGITLSFIESCIF